MYDYLLGFFLVLFAVMAAPAYLSYRRTLMRADWWLFSWTGHALTLGAAYLIVRYEGFEAGWLGVTAAVLLVGAGLGLIALNLAYLVENGHMRQDEYVRWYIVLPTHLLILIAAVTILMRVPFSLLDLIIVYAALALYFRVMYDKLDAPWILYADSRISKKRRRSLIHSALIFLYSVVPLAAYLAKA